MELKTRELKTLIDFVEEKEKHQKTAPNILETVSA